MVYWCNVFPFFRLYYVDEDTADNIGLRAAYTAFNNWAKTYGDEFLPHLGLSDKQLFFLEFAQVKNTYRIPRREKKLNLLIFITKPVIVLESQQHRHSNGFALGK